MLFCCAQLSRCGLSRQNIILKVFKVMKGFISKRAPRRSGGNGVILLALLFLLVLTRSAFGQSRERPIVLEPIIVTAERNAEQLQTGDVDRERTPAFFSVIERDQFEGKIEDLSEVIEKEVGIQVRQAGGLGSFSTVSLRGATSDQVLVFMDGILLNDASGGGVDLSGIALSDVGAIEIYRGITPINFGKASIGGVVNILITAVCVLPECWTGQFETSRGFTHGITQGLSTQVFKIFKNVRYDSLRKCLLIFSQVKQGQ